MYRLLVTLSLVLGTFVAVSAQTIETPEGTVEFIGLERWTIPMIQDSMAVYAPGRPLGQCAAVLKQLGFVSASALSREEQYDKGYSVVTVVEPHRANRIRLRDPAGDSLPDVVEWAEGIDLFTKHNRAYQAAIQWRGIALRQDSAMLSEVLPLFAGQVETIRQFWRFLDAHRTPADLEHALITLAADRNGTNAAVAAAILTNFPAEPRAWWALLAAHRDSRQYIAATAAQSMHGLLSAGDQVVDWRPMTSTIRALLDGTNVFIMEPVLSALTATQITPDLAPLLLRQGGADLVIARLGASDENTRRVARAFLVQISGIDHGDDAAAWVTWISSL